MNIRYFDNALTPEYFAAFRNQAGWDHTTLEQAQRAVQHTLFSVVARDGQTTVGMGRLLGDGSTIWYVQDLVILPAYQGHGIGAGILSQLLAYARENSLPNTTTSIALLSAKGKEEFYSKHGFYIRPNDYQGAGMMLKIKKIAYLQEASPARPHKIPHSCQ